MAEYEDPRSVHTPAAREYKHVLGTAIAVKGAKDHRLPYSFYLEWRLVSFWTPTVYWSVVVVGLSLPER